MNDEYERSHYLRKGDAHLQGRRESNDWLKSVPHVAGLNRPLQGMNKTTAKRPRPKQEEPPDAA
jgi:hypothetical protein